MHATVFSGLRRCEVLRRHDTATSPREEHDDGGDTSGHKCEVAVWAKPHCGHEHDAQTRRHTQTRTRTDARTHKRTHTRRHADTQTRRHAHTWNIFGRKYPGLESTSWSDTFPKL